MEERAVILNIFGKVQGVGFRFYTHRKAKEFNIRGYVKNMPDGSVYVEAEGNTEQLEQFILWCNNGPSWARVSKVDAQFVPATGFVGFVVR